MAADDFDMELDRARRELRELAAASTGPDGRPHEGYGEAAGGMVRVRAVEGQVSAVELDPKAMRMASQDLAEAFAAAANAALADLASKYPVTNIPTFDPEKLDAQLSEVQQESLIRMRRYEEAVADAMRQLGGR